jgi:hypothetical protein
MRCQEDQLLCLASFFFYNSVLTVVGWLLIEARKFAGKLVRTKETEVGDIKSLALEINLPTLSFFVGDIKSLALEINLPTLSFFVGDIKSLALEINLPTLSFFSEKKVLG